MSSGEAFSYRNDPAVPAFADDRAIVMFDGKCVMCSHFAQMILRRDRTQRFRLLAAQSPLGDALYRHYGLNAVAYETNVLIENGQAWFKSEASIRILSQLGLPWSIAVVGRVLPLALRDRIYNLIARNRLRWFGVRDVCYAPRPEDADRFL